MNGSLKMSLAFKQINQKRKHNVLRPEIFLLNN